jgi:6-phosphogluconolactonase
MTRAVRSIVVALVGIGAVVPALFAVPSSSGSETVMVMSNAADKNEVIAFRKSHDGQFYEAERYDTGGRGSGGTTDPLGSQGSLKLSDDGNLLFAANAGSGNVSVFRVFQDHLALIDKTPSGGSEPVAITQLHDMVYVLNEGGSGSVVAFRLASNGRLQQIKNSTVYLTADLVGGASIAIRPDGKFVVVAERVSNNIDAFPVKGDGTLGAIVVNHSTAPGVFSALFDTKGVLIVNETGPAGASSASAVSSYTVQANGTLAVITQSLPTYGDANCWNVVTPNGKWVYESNSASSSISGFTIGANGALTPIGATVLVNNPTGSVNIDVATSSDGNYLFSLNTKTGTVGVYSIGSDGTLTTVQEIPGLPPSTGFNGIAAL